VLQVLQVLLQVLQVLLQPPSPLLPTTRTATKTNKKKEKTKKTSVCVLSVYCGCFPLPSFIVGFMCSGISVFRFFLSRGQMSTHAHATLSHASFVFVTQLDKRYAGILYAGFLVLPRHGA